jgi:hypothetical protein
VFLNRAFGPRGKSVALPVNYQTFQCPETEKACYEEAVWFTQNILLATEEDMKDIAEAIAKIKEHVDQL